MTTRMTIASKFTMGDKVSIDDDIKGIVVGFIYPGLQYKVAYFHNGVQYDPWIESFRLELVDAVS